MKKKRLPTLSASFSYLTDSRGDTNTSTITTTPTIRSRHYPFFCSHNTDSLQLTFFFFLDVWAYSIPTPQIPPHNDQQRCLLFPTTPKMIVLYRRLLLTLLLPHT